MTTGFYARPTASFGYWRGGGSEIPLSEGQGSMAGPRFQGLGLFSQGQGSSPGDDSGWHPTVIYLLILVVAEMIVFGFISRALR